MATEIWKDIDGYEGIYQVSNLGNVKSLERIIHRISRWGTPSPFIVREKLIKPVNRNGYLYYNLSKNGVCTRMSAHRLVAKAFIPNPDNLPQINHKDETTDNNCVDNLEWCDAKYNINYGNRTLHHSISLKNGGKVRRGNNGRAKKVMCDNIIYDCITDCAEQYGVNAATLSGYLTGCDPMPPRWRALGLSYYEEVN